MKIALQLYTVRDGITDKNSLFATLRKVKELGYEGVEFAGFFDAPAEELKEIMSELSLTPVCCHVGVEALKDVESLLKYLNTIECKALALAWSDTSSISSVGNTCELLSNALILAQQVGVSLYYHNHDHEFKLIDNIVPIEKIMNTCKIELDTFWSFVAGYNSSEYLKNNTNKIGLVHLKDGSKSTKIPCALGEGENDIKAIVSMTKELGYDWIIVENDNPVPNGLDDAKRSITYLNSL